MTTVRRPSRCRYDKESFELAARAVHGAKYSYGALDYVTLSGLVEITCPAHGSFFQKGQHHLNGAGCSGCWKERMIEYGRAQRSRFEPPSWAPDAQYIPSRKGRNRAYVEFRCSKHSVLRIDPAQFSKISKCPKCKKEINGAKTALTKDNFSLYKNKVWRFTNKSWKHRQHFINIEKRQRGRESFHLDHQVSIADGFKNNIPPFIIGHWTNLHVKPAKENMSKGDTSEKDIELLIATFDWALKYHGGMYEYARY